MFDELSKVIIPPDRLGRFGGIHLKNIGRNTVQKLGRFNLVILLLSCLVVTGSLYFNFNSFPKPDRSTFQAVFLTNGQAYFGKLESLGKDYVKLSNIYYLQVPGLQSNDGAEAEKTKKAELIKLGGEVHSPKNYMYIPKKQILFWEDLEPTSKIPQIIKESL
ncbi:MAG: hypothetical protein Q8R55_04110 [Candidatus Taylorbacteria bacterium]|nr:hypothetical protein [Candidatus Taylorbacteria bacterium]